jgi:hypothetical protein
VSRILPTRKTKRELNLSALIGKSTEAKERRLVPEVIEDFFTEAAPIVGVNPREIRKDGHVYKVGKLPRNLWTVGERTRENLKTSATCLILADS